MKSKVGSALIATALAFGLWLYVITVISPDQTRPYYKVPVVLDNMDSLAEKQLMVVSDSNPLVTVELAGTRSDLNKINSANLTVVADLGTINEPGEYQVGYTVSPPNELLSGPITVQGRDPKRIRVVVAEKVTKDVPVQILYEGSVPDGYIKGTPELDFTQIKISGPKEVVDQIHHAAIKVDLINRTQSISQSYRYELQNEAGDPLDVAQVTTNIEQVQLKLRISAIRKIDVAVDVVDGGGATKQTTSIKIDPAQITISGSEEVIKKLDQITVGTINLAEIDSTTTKEFEILLPDGVTNESGVSKAKVTISFPELKKKTLDITNIQMLHVPEGMEADVLTQKLTVTVRGPKEQVDAITPADITAQVNLSAVTGAEMIEPVITISNKFPNVGSVGRYSVSVMVAPAAPAAEES